MPDELSGVGVEHGVVVDGAAAVAPPRGRTRSYVSARCGVHETKTGLSVWHWTPSTQHILRPEPARLWIRFASTGGRWLGSVTPPFELSARLRELHHEDLVRSGLPLPAGVPDDEKPQNRPYRRYRRDAMRAFFARVPHDVCEVLRVGWRSGSWGLFRLLQRSAEARELAASDDGVRLLWLIGNAPDTFPDRYDVRPRKLSLRDACRWLRRRRAAMLEPFGLPTTDAAVRALVRVPRAAWSGNVVDHLRTVLHDRTRWDRIRHLPQWSPALLELASSTLLPHAHHELLVELAALPAHAHGVSTTLRDTVAMAGQLGRAVPVFRSRAQLVAVHDEVMQRLRPAVGELLRLRRAQRLPSLPFVLDDDERTRIEHVDTIERLMREGQQMHHCLGTFRAHHTDALAGRLVVFALHSPERTTLAVRYCETRRRWEVDDFRRAANQMPQLDASFHLAVSLVERLQRASPGVLMPSSMSSMSSMSPATAAP